VHYVVLFLLFDLFAILFRIMYLYILLEKKSSGSRSRKQRLKAVGTRCADHVTPLYPQKLALTSPTGGGRSVGIVRSRTKATEFYILCAMRCAVIIICFICYSISIYAAEYILCSTLRNYYLLYLLFY